MDSGSVGMQQQDHRSKPDSCLHLCIELRWWCIVHRGFTFFSQGPITSIASAIGCRLRVPSSGPYISSKCPYRILPERDAAPATLYCASPDLAHAPALPAIKSREHNASAHSSGAGRGASGCRSRMHMYDARAYAQYAGTPAPERTPS